MSVTYTITSSFIISNDLYSCMNKAKKGITMANSTKIDVSKLGEAIELPKFDITKHLGLTSDQVVATVTSTRKTRVALDNKDALQDETRKAIKEIMANQGTDISFSCLKRNGTLKDANGKPVMKDGKTVPKFEEKSLNGNWVIDKRTDTMKDASGEEVEVTFYEVSRVHYYTESFEIAEYKDLS